MAKIANRIQGVILGRTVTTLDAVLDKGCDKEVRILRDGFVDIGLGHALGKFPIASDQGPLNYRSDAGRGIGRGLRVHESTPQCTRRAFPEVTARQPKFGLMSRGRPHCLGFPNSRRAVARRGLNPREGDISRAVILLDSDVRNGTHCRSPKRKRIDGILISINLSAYAEEGG